jgi:hypothetical protein
MRHRVERTRCPVCRNSDILRSICTGCKGVGEAIIVHHPNGVEISIYPLKDEARLRALYPDDETPVHERTTLVQGWEEFAKMVEVPKHPLIRREMKRSFFGGAHWMLEMCALQMDPAAEPTADDLEYLQRISAEIQKFNDAIQRGDA